MKLFLSHLSSSPRPRLLGLQAQSVLTSVLKNDNLKPKNGKLKRDRERERGIIKYCPWKEREGQVPDGGRGGTLSLPALAPLGTGSLRVPARTLCAVALTSTDTDGEHGDESSAAEGGRAQAASPGLGPALGEHVQQEFRDADEVDNLCDAEERSNDQGSAVGPFEEGRGPFPLPDLPGEKRHRQLSVHPTPPPCQESPWPCPAFLPPSRD